MVVGVDGEHEDIYFSNLPGNVVRDGPVVPYMSNAQAGDLQELDGVDLAELLAIRIGMLARRRDPSEGD